MSETDDDVDPRAAAMAIEASRNSGGAPTTAIAGNTVAVVMNDYALVQALSPLMNIWLCIKIFQFTFPPEYARMYNNFRESKIVNAKVRESKSFQCVNRLLNT